MGIVTICDLHGPTSRLASGGPQGCLDIPLIVRVAKEAGADVIHPGYGFLSERLEFAAAGRRDGGNDFVDGFEDWCEGAARGGGQLL